MAMPKQFMSQKKTVSFLATMVQIQGGKGIQTVVKIEVNGKITALQDVKTLCQQGRLKEALDILNAMNQPADSLTYVCLLQACTNKKAFTDGKFVHTHIIERGFTADRFLWNALVNMYNKCGSLVSARRVFDQMPARNVFSWTVMITAYARHGFAEEALALFHQMRRTGFQPDQFTFAGVLPACHNLVDVKDVHEEILRSGFQPDVFVASALVDMYAKSGSIDDARDVFDKIPQRDVVLWNAMLAAYAQNGRFDGALKLFQEMPERNVISWTSLIAGYAQNGLGEDALKLFRRMQLAGVKPNLMTFTSLLPACANLAALEKGMEIHVEIIRSGLQSDVFVESALLDMYAKCGSIENARIVFDKIPQPNVVSWNSMIVGYAMNGCGKEALKLFERMQHFGTNPNHITFLCVLSACCHGGLVDEGRQYFDCMSQYYQITPTMEHYGCMVGLLGRAGHLGEAQDLINKMPIKPDASVWGSLLGACKIHGNIELGEQVAERLFELNPKDATPYVLLSNMYAAAGKWDDSEKMRKMMKDRRVKKKPGCSWIEEAGNASDIRFVLNNVVEDQAISNDPKPIFGTEP
eukprot:Gb_06088 [translate_table: standard]